MIVRKIVIRWTDMESRCVTIHRFANHCATKFYNIFSDKLKGAISTTRWQCETPLFCQLLERNRICPCTQFVLARTNVQDATPEIWPSLNPACRPSNINPFVLLTIVRWTNHSFDVTLSVWSHQLIPGRV